jgi:monovalent cation:H+ antiporter, CPA1 family
MLDIAATCLVVTALFAYLNHRFIGLPTTIGVMAISLVLSLVLVALHGFGFDQGLLHVEAAFVQSIDFSRVLMQGMLSLLLFAGALHIDLKQLKVYRWPVGALALFGTSISTLVVGWGLWLVLPWLGLPLPLIHCLLFGALISPTDPIAVMGILKSAGAPRNLESVIAGESLFNDGVGVVIFALLLDMLASGVAPTPRIALELLAREGGGGIAYGLVLGYLTYRLLKSVDNYQVEVLLTLAAVMGGSSLAAHLHVSGPLAMVVAGLLIGNLGRALAMSETTRRYMDMFWELLDGILNAVLFVLIGLEAVVIAFSWGTLVAGAAAIAVTLFARWFTVGVPVHALGRFFDLPEGSSRVLTWGGLRGGISVALALSLPPGPARDTVLKLTYCVVVFSILGQGLTIGRLVRRVFGTGAAGPTRAGPPSPAIRPDGS